MHFDLRNSSLIKHIHTYVDRTWIIDLELDHDDGGKRELVDRHKNEALAFFFFFFGPLLFCTCIREELRKEGQRKVKAKAKAIKDPYRQDVR